MPEPMFPSPMNPIFMMTRCHAFLGDVYPAGHLIGRNRRVERILRYASLTK
jgi:hypothetical protein